MKTASRGPYSPPLPSEAERQEKKPMAVARDEDTPEQSFIPTTARMDQMDHEVARRFTQHRATEPMETASRKENREAESPKGYTEEDERGYRHLEDEQE